MVHYRQKLNTIADLFQIHISPHADIVLPKAGFSVWITFRNSVEAHVLIELLQANGFSRISFWGDHRHQLLNGLHLSFGSQELESYKGLFFGLNGLLSDSIKSR